jgi:hypothetical protein
MKLKGLRIADVAEIQEAVTDESKKVQKEEFSAGFQKLYDSAKACIYVNAAYFELKKVRVFLAYLRFKKITPKTFGTHCIFIFIQLFHPLTILFVSTNHDKLHGLSMWHVRRTEYVHTEIWWENMKERNNLEDLSVDGRIIIKWIVKKCDRGTWTGLIWLRTGTGGGLL